MSVMVQSVSSSQTGFIGTFPEFYKRASRTSLNIGPITDRIRDVLAESDHMDLEVLLEVRPTGRPPLYPIDEVAAVEFIRDALRVTQDQVLAAVGVAERTYFGWKQHGRRARMSSTGGLWPAVEVLFYLADAHPNLAGWFQDTAEAQALFTAGDFKGLADLELDWALRTYGPQPRRGAPEVLEAPPAEAVAEEKGTDRRLSPVAVDTTDLRAHTHRRDD